MPRLWGGTVARLTVLAVLAGACDRHTTPERHAVSADPADAILLPERHMRFYRDPDTNEPAATLVVSLTFDGTQRFILAQAGVHEGPLTVVADSAGLIPAFDSERDARAYVARVFPLDTANADSYDAGVAAYAELLARSGPTPVDLDRALRWTEHPASRDVGPVALAMVWELLAAADAALPMGPVDPMSVAAFRDDTGSPEAAEAAAEVLTLGMTLSDIVGEAQRKGDEIDPPWPPGIAEIWSDAENALLARVLRTGIANMVARLSPDAAKGDVTETWPIPSAPQLTASFLSGGRDGSRDVTLYEPATWTEQQVDEHVTLQVSSTPPPERVSVSAAARARYARDRLAYIGDMREYTRVSRAIDDEMHRIVRMRVWLKNDGDREAQPLSVRFHVPRGLLVVPSGTDPLPPLRPDEPLAPSAYEDPRAARTPWDPRPRPTYREAGRTSMYNTREQVAPGADGTTIIEHPVVGIPGHGGGEAGEIMVKFPDWRSVRPFDVDVEILLAGAPVATARLHVNATARALGS
jgi:hypothetical protein